MVLAALCGTFLGAQLVGFVPQAKAQTVEQIIQHSQSDKRQPQEPKKAKEIRVGNEAKDEAIAPSAPLFKIRGLDVPEAPKDDVFTQPSSQPVEEKSKFWPKKDPMKKGALSLLGMVSILNPNNFAGIGIGYLNVDGIIYGTLTPNIELHFLDNKLHLGFSAPINITIFDPNNGGIKAAGKIRAKDWDEWRDYFKIIQRIQYGNQEDHFYVRLSRVGAATNGHGSLMRRYNNNMFINQTHVGLEAAAYNDYAGGEVFMSDVTLGSQVLSGLAFIKPMAFFSQNPIWRSLSFGVYYAGDLKAPTDLIRDEVGVVLMDKNDNPRYQTKGMHGLGGNVEIKPVRIGNTIDVKTYFDFSKLLSYGEGGTVGALGRFNFGEKIKQGARAKLEYTMMSPRFMPAYFDSFYEIQKLQMVGITPSTTAPTKLNFLNSLDESPLRHQIYIEGTYSILDKFAVSLGYEYGTGKQQHNIMFHIECQAVSWLRFFATYHKRNFGNFGDLFKLQQNELLYGQLRLMILPVMFLNARAYKSFYWDPYVDRGLGGLRNIWSVMFDLEFGWQWQTRMSGQKPKGVYRY